MATITASAAQAGVQPRILHAGAVTKVCKYVTTGNETNDTIQFVKIPDKATVVGVTLALPANLSVSGGAVGYSVGDGGNTARFIGSATVSATAIVATINQPGGVGHRYTFSDDASVQFDTIDVTLTTGSCTSSVTIVVAVTYSADE